MGLWNAYSGTCCTVKGVHGELNTQGLQLVTNRSIGSPFRRKMLCQKAHKAVERTYKNRWRCSKDAVVLQVPASARKR